MAIITLADLANYIAIPATETAKYQSLIDSCEATLKTHLGYNPEAVTVDLIYRFDEVKNKISLKNYPVIAIYSMKKNLVNVTDYVVDNDIGALIFDSTFGVDDELVTRLKAGYDPVPVDIKDALCKLCAWESGRRNSGNYGVRTQAQGEATTSYEMDIPINIKNQVKNYVHKNLFTDRTINKILVTAEV